MPKTHDICAVVGEKSDGKPMWKSFGSVIEKDGKTYIKLESIPLHKDFDGFFSVFPWTPKERDDQPPRKARQSQVQPDLDDSIPF